MDDSELVRAIEENAAELLMAMGAAGGGRQRDDAGVRWTIGGSPIDYHNAVVAADLTARTADAVIAESLQELKNHDVPGTWHVGPSMRPTDLGERLLAAGFTHDGTEPGMAVPLADLADPAHPAAPAAPTDGAAPVHPADPTEGAAPDAPVALAGLVDPARTTGLRVDRVRTEQELGIWVETLGRGFGEGVKEARWVGEVYRRLGLEDPWRHYLGWLDGEPVATTTVYLAAGVAGVYFVMTVPEARRRGIGTAITRAALQDTRDTRGTGGGTGDTGVQYGVLGSSPAGRSVYAGLGFREYCTIDLYEWSPTLTD